MIPAKLRPQYGKGVASLQEEHEVAAEQAGEELVERVRGLLTSPTWRPPMLPAVAVKLMELSRKPQVEIPEVVRTLETDPVLAARVLKLVQSPIYASAMPVRSLQAAVIRLGVTGMRNAVLEASLDFRVVKVPGYRLQLEALRRHSQWVGHLARLVARRTSIDADFCFLCGLLHDIGVAAGLLALAEERDALPVTVAWPAVQAVHEEAAGLVARAWRLPAEVGTVLQNHHRPNVGGHVHPVVAVVCLSQMLAEKVGAGLPDPPGSPPAPARQADDEETRELALNALKLTPGQLNDLKAGAEALFKRGMVEE